MSPVGETNLQASQKLTTNVYLTKKFLWVLDDLFLLFEQIFFVKNDFSF